VLGKELPLKFVEVDEEQGRLVISNRMFVLLHRNNTKKKKKRGAKLLLQLCGIRVGIHASAVLPRVISRASVQSRWTVSTNWKWKIDSLNGEKFIKVAEVQGTEVKVCLCYIFHVAIMQK